MASTKPIKTAAAIPPDGQGSLWERMTAWENDPLMQRIQPKGLPLLFGDEDFEMGESTLHTTTADILFYGLGFHFAALTGYRVFGNLNLYYSSEDPTLYVSPDVMVVKPSRALPTHLTSYDMGPRRPAPVLVGEVLSFRTWQQGDLTRKPMLYSDLGVEEYVLVDVSGEMLEERLMLLRRQADGRWQDEQDAGRGITSRLGFRAVIEEDGQLRLSNTRTGKHYARPHEAQAALERAQGLEEELARLRGTSPRDEPTGHKGKGRRRKP